MYCYMREIFYYETDQMGIVHNSNYLRYFEEARLHHLKDGGVDYAEMEASGIRIPQSEALVKYRVPIRYGDIISIETVLTEFNGISMKYEYTVYSRDREKVLAEGYTRHCFFDSLTGVPVNIRKRMPSVFEKMKAQMIREKIQTIGCR